MKIQLKLYANLTDHLPANAHNNVAELEIPEGASIADICTQLALPEKMVHLVLVNGVFVPPHERASHKLKAGDALAIWPPVAGG